MWPGVSTARISRPPTVIGLAGPQVVVAAAEGPHRRTGQLVEAVGALGVVVVAVREQGQGDAPAGRRRPGAGRAAGGPRRAGPGRRRRPRRTRARRAATCSCRRGSSATGWGTARTRRARSSHRRASSGSAAAPFTDAATSHLIVRRSPWPAPSGPSTTSGMMSGRASLCTTTSAAEARVADLLHAHDRRRQHESRPGGIRPQQLGRDEPSRRGRPRWSRRRPPGSGGMSAAKNHVS